MNEMTPSDAQEPCMNAQRTTEGNNETMEHNDQHTDDEYFDPHVSCDEAEQKMIAMMRALLRPDTAPECMYKKIRETLDHCCQEGDCGHHKRVITKLTARASKTAGAAVISQTTIVTEHWSDHKGQ